MHSLLLAADDQIREGSDPTLVTAPSYIGLAGKTRHNKLLDGFQQQRTSTEAPHLTMTMKLLLVCALLGSSVAIASARQAAICFATEDQATEQAACVRDQAGEFNTRLDEAVAALGCTDDLCAVQKLCSFVSTDRALMALFTRAEVTFLRSLSLRCSAAAALVGTPSAAMPVAAVGMVGAPVGAVGPALLAPRPALLAPRPAYLGPRAFGARPFGLW